MGHSQATGIREHVPHRCAISISGHHIHPRGDTQTRQRPWQSSRSLAGCRPRSHTVRPVLPVDSRSLSWVAQSFTRTIHATQTTNNTHRSVSRTAPAAHAFRWVGAPGRRDRLPHQHPTVERNRAVEHMQVLHTNRRRPPEDHCLRCGPAPRSETDNAGRETLMTPMTWISGPSRQIGPGPPTGAVDQLMNWSFHVQTYTMNRQVLATALSVWLPAGQFVMLGALRRPLAGHRAADRLRKRSQVISSSNTATRSLTRGVEVHDWLMSGALFGPTARNRVRL